MEAVVELQIAAMAAVVGMTLQHTPAEAHRVG